MRSVLLTTIGCLLAALPSGATTLKNMTVCGASGYADVTAPLFCEIVDPVYHLVSTAQVQDEEFFLTPSGAVRMTEFLSTNASQSPLNPFAHASTTFESAFSTAAGLTGTGYLQIAGTVDRSLTARASTGFTLTVDSELAQTCQFQGTCT